MRMRWNDNVPAFVTAYTVPLNVYVLRDSYVPVKSVAQVTGDIQLDAEFVYTSTNQHVQINMPDPGDIES